MKGDDAPTVYITGPDGSFKRDSAGGRRGLYERLVRLCTEVELEGACPYLQKESEDPYWHDILDVVGDTHLLVAYVGNPCLRVGLEIEIARSFSIPTLLVSEADKQPSLSRLILGTPTVIDIVLFEDDDQLGREFRFWLHAIISERTLEEAATENGWTYARYEQLKKLLPPPQDVGELEETQLLGYREEGAGLVPLTAADWVEQEKEVE